MKEFEKQLLMALPYKVKSEKTINDLISHQLIDMGFRDLCLNEIKICQPTVGFMRNRWSTLCLLIGMFLKLKSEGSNPFKLIGMTENESARAGEALELIKSKIASFSGEKQNVSETKRLYDQICATGF